METATSQKKLRIVLITIAALLLVLAGILLFLSLPAMLQSPEPAKIPTATAAARAMARTRIIRSRFRIKNPLLRNVMFRREYLSLF